MIGLNIHDDGVHMFGVYLIERGQREISDMELFYIRQILHYSYVVPIHLSQCYYELNSRILDYLQVAE